MDSYGTRLVKQLDRIIEAIIAYTATVQAKNANEIKAVNTAVSELVTAIADEYQCFEVLQADSIADTAKTSQKFNAAIAQMNTDRQKADERYTAQMEIIQILLIDWPIHIS
ncbi:MAG: hypothetical protein ABG776_03955 [Cyanobacteria bacterium J06555_13]